MPLTSNIFADIDTTILEALCRKGTTDAHGEWIAVFRCFVDMKLQLPHFWGGLGVTPNAGSAISAFYAASVSRASVAQLVRARDCQSLGRRFDSV